MRLSLSYASHIKCGRMLMGLTMLIASIMAKQNELTLKQKIDMISDHENKQKSQRELSKSYEVSKSTVQRILKRKAEFQDAYEANQSNSRKRLVSGVI